MKHTPSPWVARFTRNDQGHIEEATVETVDGMVVLAKTNQDGIILDHSIADPIIEADTNLMAAAPDLLTRLLNLVMAVSEEPHLLSADIEGELAASRLAIAKAEGRG